MSPRPNLRGPVVSVAAALLVAACSGGDDGSGQITVGASGAAGRTSAGGAAGAQATGGAGAAGGGAAGQGGATSGASGQSSEGGAAGQGGAASEGGAAGDEAGGQGGDEAGGEGGAEAGGEAGQGGAGQPGGGGGGGEPGLPECDCFVKVSWCGAGVAKEAAAKGCSVPLLPAHKGDLLGCSGGAWIVKDACEFGCDQAPAGTPDTCKPDPSATCQIEPGKDGPYLKAGLHPDASDALRKLGITAGQITQTIGNAAASAGTHAKDGTAGGHDYSAATDLSVSGMTEKQIGELLDKMARVGFVAWYRKPGSDGWPSDEAKHIHAVWVGDKMKLSLRNQVRDFRVGKNGLASHATYTFHTWSKCWIDAIWERYLANNPATN